MDGLLIDIKNFLEKLENGQLDIEAGQWELHKDIANMKRTVEELKKLKEDVQAMRINNAEQMGLIKNLENKLELINKHCHHKEPETVSESSVEYQTVYRRPTESHQPTKGYKKRKCHLVRSEEIIEITSELSDKKSASDNEQSVSRGDGSTTEKADENEGMSEEFSESNAHMNQAKNTSVVRYQSHPTILQRYLKDSAKYRDRKDSCSSDVTGTLSRVSVREVTKKDTEYNNFWDEYSSRLPQNHMYQNRPTGMKKNSSGNTKPTESIIPKRLLCTKNPKKFNFKSDFSEHEKRGRGVKYIYRCTTCDKGFCSKDLLRAHEANHLDARKTKGFKCSYCDKICSTPEKLTLHLRNCRIIMRSHFKRR